MHAGFGGKTGRGNKCVLVSYFSGDRAFCSMNEKKHSGILRAVSPPLLLGLKLLMNNWMSTQNPSSMRNACEPLPPGLDLEWLAQRRRNVLGLWQNYLQGLKKFPVAIIQPVVHPPGTREGRLWIGWDSFCREAEMQRPVWFHGSGPKPEMELRA